MDSVRSQLMDMGFTEAKVQRALSSCPEASTLEQVMEWLIAHEEELNEEAPVNNQSHPAIAQDKSPVLATNTAGSDKTANEMAASKAEQRHKEENAREVEDMAKKKSISVQEAEKLIEERRIKRLEEEKKKAIEDEKARRISGQKMAETRAELEAAERVRIAQQLRQEKKEQEMRKKMIMEQIARDREARKAHDNLVMTKQNNEQQSSLCTPRPAPSVSSTPSGRPYTECRLALRLPDGTNVVQKFSPQEQLASVRLYVQLLPSVHSQESNRNKNIEFYIPPNVKLTEESMEKTLESLGLCPSSRLIVQFRPSDT